MNAITSIQQMPASSLMPADLDQAMRLASFMARAKTVPAHLQDSPGDCLMVIEASMRWGMSPFAVAQCTSVIQGKLMFEGKLVAAVVESSGGIVGHLDYEFAGSGAERSITVSAVRRGETEPRTVKVALKDARTNNGMWTKQPDQQLVYHGSRVWARRWLPAVMLGVYSPEEMGFIGTTIEGERPSERGSAPREAQPERPAQWAPRSQPAPASQNTAEYLGDAIPDYDAGPSYPFATSNGGHIYRTGSEWLERWRRLVEACRLTNALDKLEVAASMNQGPISEVASFDPQAAAEVREMLAQASGLADEVAQAEAEMQLP